MLHNIAETCKADFTCYVKECSSENGPQALLEGLKVTPNTLVHWRPHIRTMLNRTSLLFEQNLPGTDRIELILSKKALIIVQKSPDNGTILYPRLGVNDNEFYFLLLHLQHLSPQSKGFVSLHGRDVSHLNRAHRKIDQFGFFEML